MSRKIDRSIRTWFICFIHRMLCYVFLGRIQQFLTNAMCDTHVNGPNWCDRAQRVFEQKILRLNEQNRMKQSAVNEQAKCVVHACVSAIESSGRDKRCHIFAQIHFGNVRIYVISKMISCVPFHRWFYFLFHFAALQKKRWLLETMRKNSFLSIIWWEWGNMFCLLSSFQPCWRCTENSYAFVDIVWNKHRKKNDMDSSSHSNSWRDCQILAEQGQPAQKLQTLKQNKLAALTLCLFQTQAHPQHI